MLCPLCDSEMQHEDDDPLIVYYCEHCGTEIPRRTRKGEDIEFCAWTQNRIEEDQ